MSKIEQFKSEQELIGRIEQLRADGVNDDDITVFSKEKLEGTSLNYTNVNFKSADGTAWDKFVSFFTSEAPEERAMADLGLNDENKQEYLTALQAGDILLFVSEETQGASTENMEDETTERNNQSDDNAVGGKAHDAEYTSEEDDPGLPGTNRREAVSSTDAVGGSTLSADAKGHGHLGLTGENQSVEEGLARDIEQDTDQRDIDPSNVNERGDVRDEEVNVDERGISNQPGTNSDGSTRQDKDVSGYGHDSDDSGRTKRLKPNETYVVGAGGDGGDAARASGSDARITEVEADQTYGEGSEDKQDEDYEGTMRAGGDGDDAARATGSDARITEVEADQTYGEDSEDKQDKDFEGTMRAGGYEGEDQDDEVIIRDEDIERDARVVDEEPFEEYVTNETAERVDVSTYGYDDTVNRDDIETSSDGGNALTDEDLTRDDRAIRNKYKSQEVRDSEFTEHDPDRRNFNTD
ncbi:general stress protein [Salinicoccus halitifaciens]|uniref:General stress protein 17M-like domain-containing protein n=1 Tax=Salinicoccus halitifaciens TaxID=1073415 RepID=A0ABV2E8D8_9STAP|nr:general stress protein [Salinicoccus halitifaciens]MCD2137812.1 general stress protein [Salinicoccus halitifaciens]